MNDKNTENTSKQENLNFKKKEYSLSDCVLSQSTMVMWGYPTIIPITTSASTPTPTSTSTSFSSIPISVSNTTATATATTTSSLTNSVSSSTLSTAFTTVSLHSASVLGLEESKEHSLPSSLPSSSSSIVAAPKSIEKRIREEHSLDVIDGVIQKKIRKEDSSDTSRECSQGTFLGSGNVNEKEIMKDHHKLEMTGEEMSQIAKDNKNNDDNENSNSETENNNSSNNNCQMNKLHLDSVNVSNLDDHDNSDSTKQNENNNENYHEDLGITIVRNNETESKIEKKNENDNENFKEKEIEKNVVEKIKEEHNDVNEKSSSSEVNDVIKLLNVGSRVGSVPSISETKEIFDTKIIIKNENKSDTKNKSAQDDEKQCEKDNTTVTATDRDVIPLPSILAFPYYTVSMQVTRQGPISGPGVSSFRSTVSHTSDDFKLLWASSSACKASARTLSFHVTTLHFSIMIIFPDLFLDLFIALY